MQVNTWGWGLGLGFFWAVPDIDLHLRGDRYNYPNSIDKYLMGVSENMELSHIPEPI